MEYFLINENGFIVGRKQLEEPPKNEKSFAPVEESGPHLKFSMPKWDGVKWVEGLSKEELKQVFEKRKDDFILLVRNSAAIIISQNFPLYKQFNSERENTNGHLFKWLDEVREISNELEAKVKKAKSLKSLQKIVIEYPEPPEA